MKDLYYARISKQINELSKLKADLDESVASSQRLLDRQREERRFEGMVAAVVFYTTIIFWACVFLRDYL